MPSHRVGARVFAGAIFLLGIACSSQSSTAPGPTSLGRGIYERCGSDVDCTGGTVCTALGYDRFCSKPCGSGCPAGGTCGVGPDGADTCLPTCTENKKSAYFCDAGRIVACVAAPETACETCACPSDKRCEPGVGCQPKRALGKACGQHADCASGNCSQVAKVCHVGEGQPCTPDNCDMCRDSARDRAAPHICHSACGGTLTTDCPVGSDCAAGPSGGYCLIRCDTTNPSTCPQGFHCDASLGVNQPGPNVGYCSGALF